MNRIGTNYFDSKTSAYRYYAKQWIDRDMVDEMIRSEGIITGGRPTNFDSTKQKITLDSDGRWWIEDKPVKN